MGRLGDIADIITAGALIGGGYLIYRAISGFEMPELGLDITLPDWPAETLPSGGNGNGDIPRQPIPGADRTVIDLGQTMQDLLDQMQQEEEGPSPGFGGGGGGVRNGNGGDEFTGAGAGGGLDEPTTKPVFDIGGALQEMQETLDQEEQEIIQPSVPKKEVFDIGAALGGMEDLLG